MRVCLFEDRADNLEPLSLTRPLFALLCGLTSLGAKQLRHFLSTESGFLVRPLLKEITQQLIPETPVNDLDWLRAGPTILVNGRWLPPEIPVNLPEGPWVGLASDEVAFAVLDAESLGNLTLPSLPDFLDHWQQTLPTVPAGGVMIRHPWDLVEHNGPQLTRDFHQLATLQHSFSPRQDSSSPPYAGGTGGCRPALVGPAQNLWLDPSARIDPYVVADTTAGPVVIDHHAVVTAFSRLEGPCYLGPHTQVHGAKIRAGTTLGPHCRVGGEVEGSILHGFSNKYHEGFLGHSYVGEWVNLGAGTHNSDLRNDYGAVTVTVNGRPIATGQSKVGCFLGDHVKTGLGTLLNTGSNVGIFCNLLPAGRLAPKYLPPFTNWWNGSLRDGFDLEQLLATARQVMQRRGQSLTDAHANLYRALLAETAAERRRVLRESEAQALRRSA